MMLLDVTLLLEVFSASMILHSLSGGLLVRLLTVVVFLALLALEPMVWMLLDVLVDLVARPSLDSSL